MRNLVCMSAFLLASASCSQRTLQSELGDVNLTDGWIFEDVEKGYAEAKTTGKPLLVVFR